jgi:hypothetical protein
VPGDPIVEPDQWILAPPAVRAVLLRPSPASLRSGDEGVDQLVRPRIVHLGKGKAASAVRIGRGHRLQRRDAAGTGSMGRPGSGWRAPNLTPVHVGAPSGGFDALDQDALRANDRGVSAMGRASAIRAGLNSNRALPRVYCRSRCALDHQVARRRPVLLIPRALAPWAWSSRPARVLLVPKSADAGGARPRIGASTFVVAGSPHVGVVEIS